MKDWIRQASQGANDLVQCHSKTSFEARRFLGAARFRERGNEEAEHKNQELDNPCKLTQIVERMRRRHGEQGATLDNETGIVAKTLRAEDAYNYWSCSDSVGFQT